MPGVDSRKISPMETAVEFLKVGNAFEIIDGDNLRFSRKALGRILAGFQEKRIFVIAVLGPQSSGKSTLLNSLFGCKFGTGTGRCTRGVYGTLLHVDHPRYDMILVLDTEGLQSVEKDDEEFDRKITLWCLAISHAVIVNVKGDMHNSMKKLLEICCLALHQLEKTKMATPKIFFCFNQNPTPNKEPFMKQLENITADIAEAAPEAADVAKNLDVCEEDLFVVSFAFVLHHSQKKIDQGQLQDWVRTTPSPQFAVEVAKMTARLFEYMTDEPADPLQKQFQNPLPWCDMAIEIWVAIEKYPDLIKYKNIKIMKESQVLRKLRQDLEEEYFQFHAFQNSGPFFLEEFLSFLLRKFFVFPY